MITIFTIPKSFKNRQIALIQKNAIKSWEAVFKNIEIFVIGNDFGVKKIARELNLKHFPDVKTNKYGTPLLSSAFQIARENSQADLLAYINSDIIIFSEFSKLIKLLPPKSFLAVGERWDLDIKRPINFNDGDWENKLQNKIMKKAKKHPRHGSDYFIFNKANFKNIPDFAVGRVGWDNWMIAEGLRKNLKVIDVSKINPILHQNHSYYHQRGGGLAIYTNPEALANKRLAHDQLKWLQSANYVATKTGVKKKGVNLELLLNNIKKILAKTLKHD